MRNPEFFESTTLISHAEFMSAWREEDAKSGHSDGWMEYRQAEMDDYGRKNSLNYYLVVLTQLGFEHIVCKNENVLTARIEKITAELDKYNLECGKIAASTFTLGQLRRPHSLVVLNKSDYYDNVGSEKLYAVNKHRFHAFAAWTKEHGFQPVKAYLCEEPGKM
jgi:hypothetical protein